MFASGGRDVNFLNLEYEGRKSNILDNAFVVVDYEGGIRACLNLCMFSRPREELIVAGDQASLYGQAVPRQELEIREARGGAGRRIAVEADPQILSAGGHGGAVYVEHLRFYEAIRTGQSAGVGAEEGLWAVAVGVAAERSAKTGQVVQMSDVLVR